MVFCYLLSVRPRIYLGFGFLEYVQTRIIKPLSIRLLIDNQLINQFNYYYAFISAFNLSHTHQYVYSSKTKTVRNEVKTKWWVGIHLFIKYQIESTTV